MIAKGLNQVDIDNSHTGSTANPETINGSVRYQLPVLRINVPAGVSVKKINIPSSPTLAKVILNVDGNITGTGNGVNEYLVENDTGLSVDITGTGTIGARIKEEWIGPEVGDPAVPLYVNWGYSGAVAAEIGYNPTLPGAVDTPGNQLYWPRPRPYVLFERTGNQTFKFKWSWSRQDYVPRVGDRELDVSTVFGALFNADGTFNGNHNSAGNLYKEGNFDYYGRDVRWVAAGSAVINGRRQFWCGSNCKDSIFDLNYLQFGSPWASWMIPGPNPGGTGRAYAPALTASNSQRSTFINEINNGVGVSNNYSTANFNGNFVGTVV